MGKILVLAMVSLDGFISNREGVTDWGVDRDLYGVTNLYDEAALDISEEMQLSFMAQMRDKVSGYCIYEVKPGNGRLVEELFEARLADELILYVFSYTIGSGQPLFRENMMQPTLWKLKESTAYDEYVMRLHYVRGE